MILKYTGKYGEANFEKDFIEELINGKWEKEVIKNPTEEDLINNWANIIFCNNRGLLRDVPLSKTEMDQIIEQVRINGRNPIRANQFLSGRSVSITRDSDSKDTEHAGKPIFLDIFNPSEIAGGSTRYQIAEQPIFKTPSKYNDRQGDVMLLINGIPVIHIELKADNHEINEAIYQINGYLEERAFTGIYGFVQVFFAITPNDAVYFPNPGTANRFNDSLINHWSDKHHNYIKNWRKLCCGQNSILSVPAAHQLIAYYTIVNKATNELMVVKGHQYYEIMAILQRVKSHRWGNVNPRGGYIWCTPGGGKTLTSFKVGQLIIDQGLADKITFLVDRVDLDSQSWKEYNSFQRCNEFVQKTLSAKDLFNKLKSNNPNDALLVTSIQKLKEINEGFAKLRDFDLDIIRNKRIVFIVDEAQRSQFGKMHKKIKATFPCGLFFGFTGTPILGEYNSNGPTTETVFGPCLAVYSIANGIKDRDVLGFDPRAIKTYTDSDLREYIALAQCNARTKEEALADPEKFKVYKQFINLEPTTTYNKNGKRIAPGFEDLIPAGQYDCDKHRNTVIDDILFNWDTLSVGVKGTRFSAILATGHIHEAFRYYHLFKERNCGLKITVIVDFSVDNSKKISKEKRDSLTEILDDYNKMYDKHFDRDNDPSLKAFKEDVLSRIAHKNEYNNINPKGDDRSLDIVIVVAQLLTGFDSKFINTLYLDKVINGHNIIQAISRTNRVYDMEEKPFGIFRFYRKPYTMQKNIEQALRLYCEGDSSYVMVRSLGENMQKINDIYTTISKIFDDNHITNFNRLPDDIIECQKFKKEFNELSDLMNTIKLQGFKRDMECVHCRDYDNCPYNHKKNKCQYLLPFSDDTYKAMEMRFHDLKLQKISVGYKSSGLGFDLMSIKSEMAMEKIDYDYIEHHFKIAVPVISSLEASEEEKDNAIKEFESYLPKLSSLDQYYTHQIISDIRNGILIIDTEKTLMYYIGVYRDKDIDDKILNFATPLGIDAKQLKEIYLTTNSRRDLNDGMRYNSLLKDVDYDKIIEYLVNENGMRYNRFQARKELDTLVKEFIFGKEEKP